MSDKRAILEPENLLASRRREEMKERMRDGRHNFHLGKLPATIKMMRADSAELEGPSEREEKGEGQEHSSPFQL